MKATDINIRDPFVVLENGKYYLYGTRASDFGCNTGGFDVYISDDLINWSEGKECFNAEKYALNRCVNWAPEVHKYNGEFYMLATFTKENGLRGTYILKSEKPEGPFAPHSENALTPDEWECLDGTLYIDKSGKPYLVFCHEHTQIIDGTICYIELDKDLKTAVGEPKYIFSGSSPYWADKKQAGEHYVTDGPFMYKTSANELLMLWSTSVSGNYCQCVAKSENGEIDGKFIHLPLLIDSDGGHGMLFTDKANRLVLTLHTPNQTGLERPVFIRLEDRGDRLEISSAQP